MSIVERSFCESEKPLFNEIGTEYRSHLDTFRGLIRGYVTRKNLERHLTSDIQRAIDVGAGDGYDAFWLAEREVEVLMVEPSEEMRQAASENLLREPDDVQARVTSLPGDHATALEAFGSGEGFDLVMSHGVMMYQDDPKRFLGDLVKLCRPGGKLSLLTKNAGALAFRPALQGDYEEALSLIGADASVGTLGARTKAQTFQELADWLFEFRFRLEGWYGVRIFTDHLDDLAPPVNRDQILELEEAASQHDPYRSAARLLHVVASRID